MEISKVKKICLTRSTALAVSAFVFFADAIAAEGNTSFDCAQIPASLLQKAFAISNDTVSEREIGRTEIELGWHKWNSWLTDRTGIKDGERGSPFLNDGGAFQVFDANSDGQSEVLVVRQILQGNTGRYHFGFEVDLFCSGAVQKRETCDGLWLFGNDIGKYSISGELLESGTRYGVGELIRAVAYFQNDRGNFLVATYLPQPRPPTGVPAVKVWPITATGFGDPVDCPAPAQDSEPTAPPRPIDRSLFLIQRDQLSTQESEPFRFLGYEVKDEATPHWEQRRWREYREAIEGYPTALSCLTEGQQAVPIPDLLAFEWEGMNDSRVMEVCMFRVFSSLKEPRLIEQWFSYFEFRVWPFCDPHPNNEQEFPLPAFRMTADWTPEQWRSATGTKEFWPFSTWSFLPRPLGYGVSVELDQSGHISSVIISSPSK